MKHINFNTRFINALLYLGMGAILLLFPETVTKTICYLLAIGLIVAGVVNFTTYFTHPINQPAHQLDFSKGLILTLLGIFIFVKVEGIISLIPLILGFLITLSGIRELQTAVTLARLKVSRYWVSFIFSFVNLIFGIIMMANPFNSALILFRCLGIGLIFSGLTDIFFSIFERKHLEQLK